MKEFAHTDLKLIKPDFDSELMDLILELDHLRKKELSGTVHPTTFFQLKHIFHFMESLGSARIEGNNTTISDLVERKIEQANANNDEQLLEIENIEKALEYIDETSDSIELNDIFIRELHELVVKGLTPPPVGEGDRTPGKYRDIDVEISKSTHVPPASFDVANYVRELIDFLNEEHPPKYQLLKVALAHHRFSWIHPFTNGNGRTDRLLTYAMLVKFGFNVNIGNRILNPSAIFCSDRDEYYIKLAEADSGTEEGLTSWCTYVLSGLKRELDKIDKLLDKTYLTKEVLMPALKLAFSKKFISDTEFAILKKAIEVDVLEAKHVRELFPDKIPQEISRMISNMKKDRLLMNTRDSQRKYTIRFFNNYLMRAVVNKLVEKEFIVA